MATTSPQERNTITTLPSYQHLRWVDNRWHLDGRGIHAGDVVEILRDDGLWMKVRVESKNAGQVLMVYFDAPGLHGRQAHVFLRDNDVLRWP